MRNDLHEIVGILSSFGLSVTVTTNGIRLRQNVIDVMKANTGKFKFSIHFGDERNDSVVRNKSFLDVSNNVKRVVNAGIQVGINTVVVRENIDSLDTVAEAASSWAARKVSFFLVVRRGAARSENYVLESEEAFREKACKAVDILQMKYPNLKIRLIDIAASEYWIVDHDGSLFVSAGIEENDTIIYKGSDWI